MAATTVDTDVLLKDLAAVVGADNLTSGDAINEDHGHDEALTVDVVTPAAVVRPPRPPRWPGPAPLAAEHRVPVTPRGSGTGLSGACVADPGRGRRRFEQMNRDPGDRHREPHGRRPARRHPGPAERRARARTASSTRCPPARTAPRLGGNVATNAGGMRAVKYGVTRHHVLGLEAVLPGGEVIRTGGKLVKTSRATT